MCVGVGGAGSGAGNYLGSLEVLFSNAETVHKSAGPRTSRADAGLLSQVHAEYRPALLCQTRG